MKDRGRGEIYGGKTTARIFLSRTLTGGERGKKRPIQSDIFHGRQVGAVRKGRGGRRRRRRGFVRKREGEGEMGRGREKNRFAL